MATTYVPSAGDIIRPYGKCRVKHYPMAASQTFKRGYPVILDASTTQNRVRVASTDPTAALVGIAAADASVCANSDGTTTNAMVPVWLAQPFTQFRARTIAGTAIAGSQLGQAQALEAHASLNIWVVDIGDQGNDSVVIEEFIAPAVIGDSEGEVVFHFDPKATIFGAGT